MGIRGFGSGVWRLGFRFGGLGFGDQGFGFGVWGLKFRVWGLDFGFEAWRSGFRVWGLEIRVWGFGFGDQGLGFGVRGLGFRVWVLKLGFREYGLSGTQCRSGVGSCTVSKVDVRLPGKENSNSHGARPVHLVITTMKWIRTSGLSIKNSLSSTEAHHTETSSPSGVWG